MVTLTSFLERDGFVVIPSVLSPEQLETLRAAATRTTELARSGKWPLIRTVGKQFPPWTPDASLGIWGVQSLMHPELPDHDTFAQSYFAENVLSPAKQLMSCGDEDLVMELYNMLVRPDKDFELRWHRDDIPPDADDEEELERLNEPAFHTQWNLALFDDESLVLVPGSHRRARTKEERDAGPYDVVADQMTVKLKAGDVAFYNNNIFHRGVYDSTKERMTLHGSVGHAKGSKLRARNVLQHGIGSWVDRCDFSALGEQKERAEAMRDRLVRLGRDSGEVGYSLDG